MPGYAELQVCSNYSFLRGASRIEELLLQAEALGIEAIAITDHTTLAGIARAHTRAAEVGIRLIVGCRLELRDSLPLLAYPLDRAGYGCLCRMLTLGKGRTGKGGFDIAWADLQAEAAGLLIILLPDQPDERLDQELRRMWPTFDGRCYLALTSRSGLGLASNATTTTFRIRPNPTFKPWYGYAGRWRPSRTWCSRSSTVKGR